ncbi:uroporphyrinogen-III synthase [Agrilactobacillus yilanensis]|uniref:Uroporphyrinogen-III synthase n=1 Tax=Agrilactobacillus yilanensis TaxID=2485997 RepID=A0ABW4J7M7_9LACO|nr:uroporphyrinogen-III synthase [Agrilactobacillus yilanensis]
MANKYLITRSQTSLPPKLMAKLLQNDTDFINLMALCPVHLQQKQIAQIKQADILALTSGFALTCIQPFFEKATKKPQLAVLSSRLQTAAQKAGFDSVLVSKSEQQDSLATMLRAKLFREQKILWLRGNLSDRYNPLRLATNWQSLIVYKNLVNYQQLIRLKQLLRNNQYTKILVTSNSAFERILEADPEIKTCFVSMSYKSTQLIRAQGFEANAPKQKQQRLQAAIDLLLTE